MDNDFKKEQNILTDNIKVIGIICEYNPFHNGHKKLIDEIHEKFGNDCIIISLMSGHFTQRGQIAIYDKYIRAEAAVRCGSDLVIEFPFPCCSSVAEVFARSGVEIFDELGGVDYLAFGSECGDIDILGKIANNTMSGRFESEFAKKLNTSDKSISYRRLYEKTYEELYGDIDISPNDVLGVEYLKALKKIKSKIVPVTFKREGDITAKYTRDLILKGDFESLVSLVPPDVLELYVGADIHKVSNCEDTILYLLRHCEADDDLADVSPGLSMYIRNNAMRSSSYDDLIERCNSKIYTNSRIRRTILKIIFGLKDDSYGYNNLLMLSCNDKGRRYLSSRHSTESVIKVVTRGSDCVNDLIIKSDDLFNMSSDDPKEYGYYVKHMPYIE